MATWWMDGFDDYDTPNLATWYTVTSTAEIVSGGRFGNRLRLSGGGALLRTLTPGMTEVVVALALTMTNAATYHPDTLMLSVGDGDGWAVGFKVLVDGSIRVYRSSDATPYRGLPPGYLSTVLGTSTAGVVVVNEPCPLEMRVVLSDTVGQVEIRKAGTVVLSLTNVDTKPASVTAYTFVHFNRQQYSSDYQYMDDVCVGDSFHGDSRVDSHLPTADLQEQWTPSSGVDSWAMVDDAAPDGDTTTLTAATVGFKSTFQCEALKNSGATVIARQLGWIAKKPEAGASSVGSVLTHSGSDTDGSGQALTTTYLGYMEALAGCSESDFNADRYGLQKTD